MECMCLCISGAGKAKRRMTAAGISEASDVTGQGKQLCRELSASLHASAKLLPRVVGSSNQPIRSPLHDPRKCVRARVARRNTLCVRNAERGSVGFTSLTAARIVTPSAWAEQIVGQPKIDGRQPRAASRWSGARHWDPVVKTFTAKPDALQLQSGGVICSGRSDEQANCHSN